MRVEYEARRRRLEILAESIRAACQASLDNARLPYHSVKSRVKALSSALEKISRKGYRSTLEDIQDLVGVRVICLYRNHVDPIVQLLKGEFKVLEYLDKRPSPGSTRFGYGSVHITCSVEGTPRSSLPEYFTMGQIPFEIQVRTILQEAWAEIEHQLVYKSETSTPEDVKRQITRVSALLEVADKEFQEVFDLRNAYVGKLKEADLTRLHDEPLNIDSLWELINRRYQWARGWEEVQGDEWMESLDDLVDEARRLGIHSVRQLLSVIDKWYEVEFKESQKAYRIATGVIEPQNPVEEGYTDDMDSWNLRTKHYFFPIGQIRGILRKEFLEKDRVAIK